MRRLFAALLACIALPAFAQKMEVRLLPVDSMDGFMQWMQQKPAPAGTYPRAQQLAIGKKVYAPIVVTGIDPNGTGPIELVGDFEMVGPDGKSQSFKKCCRFAAANRAGLRTAVLSGPPTLEMDSGDPKGMYTMRATVTDGKQTVSGSEQIAFGGAPKAAAPAVEKRAAAPAVPGKASRGDVTRCLDLPTPQEVIRCTEGK